MNKPTIVTFLGPWRGYSAGEVAGFDKDTADKLIDAGRAELAKKGKKGAAAKAAQAPAGGDGSPDPDTSDSSGGGEPESDGDDDGEKP